MVGDLLVLRYSNRPHLLQIAKRLDLGGLVVVTIVGADGDVIFSRVAENVIHVVICLAGNILPVLFHGFSGSSFPWVAQRRCKSFTTYGIHWAAASAQWNLSLRKSFGTSLMITE